MNKLNVTAEVLITEFNNQRTESSVILKVKSHVQRADEVTFELEGKTFSVKADLITQAIAYATNQRVSIARQCI